MLVLVTFSSRMTCSYLPNSCTKSLYLYPACQHGMFWSLSAPPPPGLQPSFPSLSLKVLLHICSMDLLPKFLRRIVTVAHHRISVPLFDVFDQGVTSTQYVNCAQFTTVIWRDPNQFPKIRFVTLLLENLRGER